MMQKRLVGACIGMCMVCASCVHQYQLTSVQRTRIVVDQRYDATHDKVVEMLMRPYKENVDSLMAPVVGRVARDMSVKRPESTLSNLLSDILVWGAKKANDAPDFAVYNMGGIRAALVKGDVTIGDVVDVAPFENKLCLLTLTGAQVLQLFEQMASVGGEGVSKEVRLVITKDRRLKSALINGKKVNPNAKYRIATLDYLAQGNDKLVAFKHKTDVVSPQVYENNVRFIIMDYFRQQAAKHEEVDAKIEGRIVVE